MKTFLPAKQRAKVLAGARNRDTVTLVLPGWEVPVERATEETLSYEEFVAQLKADGTI